MNLQKRTPVRDAADDGVSRQKVNMEKHLKIAIFIDFDNIEIGVKSTLQREFDVSVVLEALKERGEIVTKIVLSYCFSLFTSAMKSLSPLTMAKALMWS